MQILRKDVIARLTERKSGSEYNAFAVHCLFLSSPTSWIIISITGGFGFNQFMLTRHSLMGNR
jgi:hypothetical protein